MNGRRLFKLFNPILSVTCFILKVFPRSVRMFFWEIITPFSGKIFIGMRYALLKSMLKSCGRNIRIGEFVKFLKWDRISIGDNVSIHAYCYIDGTGEIVIKDNVSIAHHVSILSTSHSFADQSIPIKYNPIVTAKVTIENDVWIGCGSRILYDVHLYSRSIIGAGSIVNKDVDPNSVYAGVPARKIKNI